MLMDWQIAESDNSAYREWRHFMERGRMPSSAHLIGTWVTLLAIGAYVLLLFFVGARPQDVSAAMSGLAAGCLPLTITMALRGLRVAYRMVPADVQHLVLVSIAFVLTWTGIGVVSAFDASITSTLEFRVGMSIGVLLGLMWLAIETWRD